MCSTPTSERKPDEQEIAGVGLTAGLLAGAGAGLILETVRLCRCLQPSHHRRRCRDDRHRHRHRCRSSPIRPARLQEVLQPLIDDGTITQAQADKVIAALLAAAPPRGRPWWSWWTGHGRPGHGPDFAVVADDARLTGRRVRTRSRTVRRWPSSPTPTARRPRTSSTRSSPTSKSTHRRGGHRRRPTPRPRPTPRSPTPTTRVTEFVNNTPAPPKAPALPVVTAWSGRRRRPRVTDASQRRRRRRPVERGTPHAASADVAWCQCTTRQRQESEMMSATNPDRRR